MKILDNPVRPYAWGSSTAIAELQRRAVPSETPEAELWIGAHPDDPSQIDGIGLDKLISVVPIAMVGAASLRRFGDRLPYLLKYLAADAPLSIQVHPSTDHAGPRGHHKPEMLVARTRFEALCGFRPAAEIAEDLVRLDVPEFAPVINALRAGDVRFALATVLGWSRPDAREVIADALHGRAALSSDRADLLARLAIAYPADPGVIVTLMLRRWVLEPGEAIYVAPGQLHSYVSGVGVEIMASSDCVVRGGLTAKHVDVHELLRIVDVQEPADPHVTPVALSEHAVEWPVPVPDFRLQRIHHAGPVAGLISGPIHATVDPAPISTVHSAVVAAGPRIVFCTAGTLDVADDAGMVRLRSGDAAFGAAGDGEIHIRGIGEVFVASL